MKLITLILFLISLKNFAITLSNSVGATFPGNDVKVNVSSGSCDNIGVSADRLLELTQVAVDRFWNTVPTSRLRLEKGSLVSVNSAFKTDAICTGSCSLASDFDQNFVHSQDIIIACNNDTSNNFTSAGTLALAVPINIQGEDIVGSVILINDTATTSVDDLSENQLISTIAHEIGHAIGLGHAVESQNLMYFATLTDQFYLGENDVHAITLLYGSEEPFSGCGTISMGNNSGGGKGLGLILFAIAFVLVTAAFQSKELMKTKSLA